MKKKLTDKEIKRLEVLNRKQRTLLDNKEQALKMLNPILEQLEKIRLEIDSIELK